MCAPQCLSPLVWLVWWKRRKMQIVHSPGLWNELKWHDNMRSKVNMYNMCIYIIYIFIVYSLSLSIYIDRVIHIYIYMRSQMSNPPRPPFCASWPGSPWFLQSSSQVDGDHLKPMIIQASDWYLGGARAGHCKDTPWVSPKICGVPNSTALPCFFCHNWNCHLGSTSHFQTHSLHAAERCLFCGRNCLCKSLGRKHVAWGATREKVCGEIDFHCHKGRIPMVPEIIL